MSLQTTQDVYRRVINEVVRELKEDPSMKDILTPPVLDYLKKVRKKHVLKSLIIIELAEKTRGKRSLDLRQQSLSKISCLSTSPYKCTHIISIFEILFI